MDRKSVDIIYLLQKISRVIILAQKGTYMLVLYLV